MILLAALLCNYGRGKCLIDIGTEGFPLCRRLFPNEDGHPITDFRKSWDTTVAAIGMPDLLFHDLRRSAVRNMIRSGIAQKVAMDISGHKTASVFERYNIVDERDMKNAGALAGRYMESFLNGSGK
jgi:integrase